MGFVDLNNGGSGPSNSGYGPVPDPIYRKLDINGDGSGNSNATGNYSSSEEIFYIQPPAGEIFRLERMLIFMRMKKGDMKFDRYGKDQVLTTGIVVRLDNDTVQELTNGVPVKRFGDWMRVCFDVTAAGGDLNNDYNADAIVGARWTFSKAGYPLRLVGDNNDKLEVVLNDNFSGKEIYEHYFMVQGYKERTT